MPTLPFIPDDFQIPGELTTDRLLLRPLTIHDLDADYDAVMTSIEHLRKCQPFGPDHDWPSSALSRDQNLVDLGWHHKEFQRRTSFTYTVRSPDNQTCLGCVYLYPSTRQLHDAMVILWVRASESSSGLDAHLHASIKEWIRGSWPFTSPCYPGRDLPWNQWNQLPAK